MLKKCWYCASKSCCLEIPVRLQKCFAALFLNRFHAMRSSCTFKSKPIAENINSFSEIIILEKLLETRLVFRPTWLYFLYVYQVKEVPLKLLRISIRLLLELRCELKIITESVHIMNVHGMWIFNEIYAIFSSFKLENLNNNKILECIFPKSSSVKNHVGTTDPWYRVETVFCRGRELYPVDN